MPDRSGKPLDFHRRPGTILTMKPTTPAALAAEFSRSLRKTLTVDQIVAVNTRNKAETNPSICHSHDFCDANDCMDEAFIKLTGVSAVADAMTNEKADLWNAAWTIAKANLFAVTP